MHDPQRHDAHPRPAGDTTAAAIAAHLESAIEPNALLVTDGAPFSLPCARSLGVTHQSLDHKAGERRGDVHPNTVNSRHERLKTFLRGRRGVATKIPRQLPRLVPSRHPAQATHAALTLDLDRRAHTRRAAGVRS